MVRSREVVKENRQLEGARMTNIERQIQEYRACKERGVACSDCSDCPLGYTLLDINWADEETLTICQVYEALDEYRIERLQYEVEKRQGKWGILKGERQC